MEMIRRQVFFMISSLLTLLTLIYNVSGETNKTICAVRTDTPPVIDGRLDEAVWQKAAKISDFIQHEPEVGGRPTYPTTVYLLYDTTRLYVGFECVQDMESLQASATRRDAPFFNDDYVGVYLDTFHDKRNCYAFSVNLLSAQSDRRIANEGANQRSRGPGGDTSWDCDWDGSATKGEGKWTAEISIPFSELRFKKESSSVWGINFWRNIESLEEEDTWADVGNREMAVSRFGELVELPTTELSTTRPLELKPYVVAKPRKTSDWEIFEEGRQDIGLDIRYPFSNITVDMTINPDFAQVEADPERINLSDTPTRFPEKRPFFQEGAELFRTPIDIFYSREIADPSVGIKMAGKIGNYNVAMLDSQAEGVDDDEEEEKSWSNENNNFLVLRTQRDIGTSSTIGFLGVNKQNQNGYNRALGIDTTMSLPKDIRITGQYALTRGSNMVDNPDADAFRLRIGQRINDLSFDFGYRDIGRDFNADAGFVPESRIDRRGVGGGLRYRRQFKSKVFKRVGGGMEYQWMQNHDGERTNERREAGFHVGLWDFWVSPSLEWYFHHGVDDDADKKYIDKTLGIFGGWFPPKWAMLFTRMEMGTIDDKETFFAGPELTIRPTENIALRADIQWLKQKDGDDEERRINRRFTFEYRFTQRMHFRSSIEMTRETIETASEGKSMFALYSWEFQPESNLFLVYTMNQEEGEDTEHNFFAKIAYLMKWEIW